MKAVLMNAAAINETIKVCLNEICSKLDEVNPRGRGPRPGCQRGGGVEVSMDIE
jgi:hypothetical protein